MYRVKVITEHPNVIESSINKFIEEKIDDRGYKVNKIRYTMTYDDNCRDFLSSALILYGGVHE